MNESLLHTYNRFDVTFDRGEGVTLYDTNGKKYLDFFSGIGVNAFGYGYKKYTDALHAQINKLTHISNYFYTEPLMAAADKFTKASGMDRVFFTNSGGEAVEGALKLARKYAFLKGNKEKTGIIAFTHSFHGRTIGAVSVTGTKAYREPFGPLLQDVSFAVYNDIDSVKALVNENTCAIILETIQGEGGIHVADKDFLTQIREICDKYDIVMILDEIQCGVGRSGKMFAYQNFGILPDVVASAKGIAAGVPVGAFACKEAFAALMPGDHGSTYGGNPLATAAVSITMDIFGEDNILENVNIVGKYLYEKLEELASSCSHIKSHRGMGLMQGIELDIPASSILKSCLSEGLVLISAGSNVIRFLPPLIITKEDVDTMIEILSKVLA